MIVTITGVDDNTDLQRVEDLSAQFPFVEWGVLYSHKRKGSGRYPTKPLDLIHQLPRVALHLCGQASRSVIGGEDFEGVVAAMRQRGGRIQLNGYKLISIFFANAFENTKESVEFILQCRSQKQFTEAQTDVLGLSDYGIKATRLFDPSGGRGVDTNFANLQKDSVGDFGIAGGIGPDNITSSLEVATTLQAAWIDMESRVRTEDKLDLDKVERVLTLAKEFL